MTTLSEILQNPEFGPFHVTGKEVNGKCSAFILQPGVKHCHLLNVSLHSLECN